MRHKNAIEALSKALRRRYGRSIRSVRVFGSVARGTDTPESDIDVMIVVGSGSGSVDWKMERAMRGIALSIELEEDVVFDLKVVAEREMRSLRRHTPFIERVALEGIAV